jgi:hypothetical protein
VINCHNTQVKNEGGAREAEQARPAAAALDRAGQGKERGGRGRGRRRQVGLDCQRLNKKEKRRRERWAVAGRGLAGRWAGRAER